MDLKFGLTFRLTPSTNVAVFLQVLKEFHLLDLLEISCSVNDRDLVYFRFKSGKAVPPAEAPSEGATTAAPNTIGTVLVTVRDSRTNLLVKNVRESLRRMTCGVHPYYDVKVIIPPDQYALLLLPSPPRSIAISTMSQSCFHLFFEVTLLTGGRIWARMLPLAPATISPFFQRSI